MTASCGAERQASQPGASDVSEVLRDGSSGAVVDAGVDDVSLAPGRYCLWCQVALANPLALYCSKQHRQAAWRARQLASVEGSDGAERRLAYADPPYPGLSRKCYGDEPTYAGEVDHAELIAKLTTYDGWALSTSGKASVLRWLLPLCPADARLAVWGKPIGVPTETRGPHNVWEALIYVPARRRKPGVPDYLRAQPARFGNLLWCMLNPSTAGAATDDPTSRKVAGFTRRLGFARWTIVNCYAFRATYPSVLEHARRECGIDVVGPENLAHVLNEARCARQIVVAWGAHHVHVLPGVLMALRNHAEPPGTRELYCLGTTKSGLPRHPLMLSYDTPLVAWGGES